MMLRSGGNLSEWIDTIGSNSANRKYTTVNYTTDITEITSGSFSEVSPLPNNPPWASVW